MSKFKNIHEALLEFQKVFEGVSKTRKNSFTNSSYANLDDVWNAASKTLSDLGLVVTQSINVADGRTVLNCEIRLVGEGIEGDNQINSSAYLDDDKGAQVFGSELTYKKRYLLCAMLNIVEAEDDDGNLTNQNAPLNLTERQHSQILDLIDATGTKMDKFSEHLNNVYKTPDIEHLSTRQASTVVRQLETKLKRMSEATND